MIEPLLVWWPKNNVTNANFGPFFALKSFCFMKIGSKSKKLDEFLYSYAMKNWEWHFKLIVSFE